MKIFICLLVVFFVLFFTSELKLNIENLEKSRKSKKIKYKVNLGIYLFGFLKIIRVNFKEDGIHFLFFKSSYKKIKIDKNNIKLYLLKDSIKSLNPKLEKMNFKLNIGVEDIEITVFLVFIISTFFSILPAKYIKQIDFKNYIYKITPQYNKNLLSFKASLKISVKIINLIKTIFLLREMKKQRNLHIKYVIQKPLKI